VSLSVTLSHIIRRYFGYGKHFQRYYLEKYIVSLTKSNFFKFWKLDYFWETAGLWGAGNVSAYTRNPHTHAGEYGL